MAALLRSISITDFRSIRGTVSIPLDASIVLIHGQNGAGKTSLLSGIELALTGAVPSLQRLDENYFAHLVHKDAPAASITIAVNSPSGELSKTLAIKNAAIQGEPLFNGTDATFFNERCYLAQSTMNRLLELYQGKELKKGDSALTKFVKDLLGLDQLDSLINGLDDAGHLTRLKNALPEYRSSLEEVPTLESRRDSLSVERSHLGNTAAQLHVNIGERGNSLAIPSDRLSSIPYLQEIASSQADQVQLQRIAQLKRDVVAARTQWEDIRSHASGAAVVEAERTSAKASEVFSRWMETGHAQVAKALLSVRSLVADQPDITVVGPRRALDHATQSIGKELNRVTDLVNRDAEDKIRLSDLDEQIERAAARLEALDEQIAGHLANADLLAQALTSLMPLIDSQKCPVCGRDFGEISSDHLQSHLSAKISTLVESSGRLQGFVRERSEALKLRAEGVRHREVFVNAQLSAEDRTKFSLLRVELEESMRILKGLALVAAEGELLIGNKDAAGRELSELRSKNEQATSFRSRLVSFEAALDLPSPKSSEETETILAHFESVLEERHKRHLHSQEQRTLLALEAASLKKINEQFASMDEQINTSDSRLRRVQQELNAFQAKMLDARELAKIAKGVRTEIVRSVFSGSLNALWKELFIRLAPNELFVPAFELPEKEDGVVEARLETLYRDGGRGGNPRAMLSAGNLNTAALTLFLALHLSVEEKFPCLIIDDPVQSMDEVHIAQMAALLRTLSRQHGRQVIIAVHEKPLFDYLALELTPASGEERLITVELGASSEGMTFYRHEVIGYSPDKTFVAA